MKKLLYSMRYPLDTDPEEADGDRELPSFEEMLRRIESASYEPRPDGAKAGRRFAVLAKAFSEKYELDLDIWERAHDISVEFHLLTASFAGASKAAFLTLAALSDEIELDPPAEEGAAIALALTYHTHDRVG